MDVFKVSKTVDAPLPYIYRWCTDFSEADPQLTGSKSQRTILEKTRKKAIFVQIYEGADGRKNVEVNIVTLKPPDSWYLDFFGQEDSGTAEYRLKSLGKGKTRLDMVFREKWKIDKSPSVEEQVSRTSKVWDKYVAALEGDYKSEKGSI